MDKKPIKNLIVGIPKPTPKNIPPPNEEKKRKKYKFFQKS
jgi:hypothetical protein